MIDFSAVDHKNLKLLEFSQQFTLEDLRKECDISADFLLELIDGLTDDDITFDPVDEEANDPYAVEGEEHIGWSVAHLIAHVTASTEEGAAFSSLLARGVPAKQRPRYETPWRDITTHAQCVQRIEESRRIRRAYLDTWPDEPHLDVMRDAAEGFRNHFGDMNATTAFIFGLMHEYGHHDQIKEVKSQALAARQSNAARA